nr:hypothetical protein [Actinomycetota bacterium]
TVTGLTNGTYQYRVKATRSGYADSAYEVSSTCTVTLTCGPISSISVPSSSTSGSFPVNWGSSSTSGVTYVLDQSADGGATWTNIYTGPNNYFTVTGLPAGSYQYRVKATEAGYADSAYMVSGTVTVP